MELFIQIVKVVDCRMEASKGWLMIASPALNATAIYLVIVQCLLKLNVHSQLRNWRAAWAMNHADEQIGNVSRTVNFGVHSVH